MKIKSLTLEAFRGFLDKVTFNFQDADVLLLYGPNGHGKTSIFDSIEWVLTGEIHRFSVPTDERKRTRFIRNLNADVDQTTYVTLVLQISSSRIAEVTRVCTVKQADTTDYGKSTLKISIKNPSGFQKEINGDEAEMVLQNWLVKEAWRDNIEDTSRIIALTHILGQEKLNEFVRGMKDGDRYNSLSVLFGTEHFLKYKDSFKKISDLLKIQIQQREGQLQEVQHSINSIEESISKLNKKILLNDNISLKEVLSPYLGYFNNIKQAYEQEQWQEVKKICVQNQEMLKKERYKLENTTYQFKEAKGLLDGWREGKKFLNELPAKRKTLNQLIMYKEKLDNVENLLEHLPRFIESSENRVRMTKEVQESKLAAEEYIRAATELEDFVKEIRQILQNILEQKEFSQLPKISPLSNTEEKIRNEILSYIYNLKSTNQILNNLEISIEMNSRNLKVLDVSIKDLQGIDTKYQIFLNALNEYISVQTDIDYCPACGTKGISELVLKNRIAKEQEKMNETLPELEKQFLETKNQLDSQDKELQRLREQQNKEEKEIKKLLVSLEKKAMDNRELSNKKKSYEQQLYNEMQIMEKFLTNFQLDAKKLNIDTDQFNLKERLISLKEQLQSHLSSLSVEDRENLLNKVKIFDRKEQQTEEDINRFINKLSLLESNSTKIDKFGEEEVLIFLEDVSKKHAIALSSLEQKEEISLKVLNALEHANDELQLVEFQANLEKQREYFETITKEKNDINSDYKAVQSVIDNVKNALDGLNNKMMDQLFDTVGGIFSHINSHPMYSKVKFSKEHRNRAYRLLIYVLTGQVDAEVPANASYIFSSAQINTIALSFFISMSLHQNWSPLQLMGMDDPIQSMDEINTLAFIDLVRLFIEKHNKQIIISTHDHTFYKMMLRKFRFQNVAVIEYEGYSQNGPSIRRYANDGTELIQYYQKKNIEELTQELIKVDHVL
ncbi:AAA family ATPase [Bacillus sp. B1-b2]|uniref:AAA family ATPase n=1 Tax=Bacillus sp. B1-b2 TaxID=2653201 RepID=UPI00126256AF|nr:SMC family ATPase [Bacillus sp. B1-b2]KAB7665554.1 SMC family ATPase [Bacillus sp. B1-b2]